MSHIASFCHLRSLSCTTKWRWKKWHFAISAAFKIVAMGKKAEPATRHSRLAFTDTIDDFTTTTVAFYECSTYTPYVTDHGHYLSQTQTKKLMPLPRLLAKILRTHDSLSISSNLPLSNADKKTTAK